MMYRRSILAGFVMAAPLTLGLVGCGDEDAPKPTVSDSASESPSQSSSESSPPTNSPSSASPAALEEPTPPAEMEGDDAAAAEAFIEHYFDLATYAVLSGDSGPSREAAARICRACRGFTDAVDYVYRRGGSVSGGEFSVIA